MMNVYIKTKSTTFLVLLVLCFVCWPATRTGFSQERTLTAEQLEALQKDGELEVAVARPAKLPDLTKGESAGERNSTFEWFLGPTGIEGYMVGGLTGDQIEVTSVLSGSPGQGKFQWGDVILGVNGKKFKHNENMGLIIGNAIIEAEKEENGGILKLTVWRDKNFFARNGKKDIYNKDIDELIDKSNAEETLYDWKPEEAQKQEIRSSNFKEFPIESEVLEVTLTLEVMPAYSDTSPYDCPKAERIRENAWKVLEEQMRAGKVAANRYGTIIALALVASGKPEHRELVREWVRSPKAKGWHPSVEGSIDMMKGRGYISWFMSYDALDCALYYDATGDEFVLPAIREYAIKTAMGQDAGGSWGHTFAWPVFNGGKLHGMNPGYGALNAAGNRCFFLIALAKKLGIEHPEIDDALARSTKYFGSYIDKGAIPYGQHGAAASDDSNGKNAGVAFALKLLGDNYGAKYFAQMSTHASFTRRGGHGCSYTWHWSPWAATLVGPRGTIATHRNLRWWSTLCRMHDGSFVDHAPGQGSNKRRSPTATYALHYSAPLKQTLITGKDADESMFWNDEEFDELMASARPQLNDPKLLEQSGTAWQERSTDELFDLLDMFLPKSRGRYAEELANRYLAGEEAILPRLGQLLESDDARARGAACVGLAACGNDAAMQYFSGLAKLLKDDHEFVRMQAARAMTKITGNIESRTAILQAIIDQQAKESMSPNSFSAVAQNIFKDESKLAASPFNAGIDDELVEASLEQLITLDPTGNGMMFSRRKIWDKDTVVRLAGPIIYTAEYEQIADQMFSGRRGWSLDLLRRLGYQELIEASTNYLREYLEIPRQIRSKVHFKRGQVEALNLMAKPSQSRHHLADLRRWLLEKPLDIAHQGRDEPPIYLHELIAALEAAEPAPDLPRLADEAAAQFQSRLDALAAEAEKIKLCETELADPQRFNYFAKISAMNFLVKVKQADAFADLLPYLGHRYWRMQQHSQKLAIELVKAHGETALTTAFPDADVALKQGLLHVLAEAKAPSAVTLATQALSHESPLIRGTAAKALISVNGQASIPLLFESLKAQTERESLDRFESALLLLRDDAASAELIRSSAISMLPDSSPEVRDSLYWLLGQVGGEPSMKVLSDALSTNDDRAFASAVTALSYSPDAESDKLILNAIRANPKSPRATLTANEGVRRMVIGEEGYGLRPIEEQLDFAEAVLEMNLNNSTIAYLGRIKTGRCAFILQKAMRRGAPSSAAEAIVEATSDLSKADKKDRQLAESALADVIEFIEVTYIRGTATDRVSQSKSEQMQYIKWRAISAEAGKNLLKLTQSKEPEPLPEFDDSDLDF